MSPTGDQLHAPAQVVTQLHHTNLIFVANLANTLVVNVPEGFLYERKGLFDARTKLSTCRVNDSKIT